MTPQLNNTYIGYADTVFSYFNGMKEHQGCFLMRTIRAQFRNLAQQETVVMLSKIIFNLCVNGYLYPKDSASQHPLEGFMALTQKGADYINGGPLSVKVDLNQYVSQDSPILQQYEDLWSLIGDQKKAPFYVKGTMYVNMIRPYLTVAIGDYMAYMDYRRHKELSTSRRVWYRDLYELIPQERRSDFLGDLSYAISLSYYYTEEEVDDEYAEALTLQVEQSTASVTPFVEEITANHQSPSRSLQTPQNLLDFSVEICNAFKSMVENNRMYRLLYNDDGTPKNETASQLLFFCFAQTYGRLFDVDVNRECDNGAGELDFKFSVGQHAKVVLEMKLSTNSSIYHGYEKQLPAYLRAEEASHGILLIVELSPTQEPEVVKTLNSYNQDKQKPNHCITVIKVNAAPKPSASKL